MLGTGDSSLLLVACRCGRPRVRGTVASAGVVVVTDVAAITFLFALPVVAGVVNMAATTPSPPAPLPALPVVAGVVVVSMGATNPAPALGLPVVAGVATTAPPLNLPVVAGVELIKVAAINSPPLALPLPAGVSAASTCFCVRVLVFVGVFGRRADLVSFSGAACTGGSSSLRSIHCMI